MIELLGLIPGLPLFGALLLMFLGKRMSRPIVLAVGVGSVGVAAVLTLLVGIAFLNSGTGDFDQHLWRWFKVGGFTADVTFHLDALSLAFLFVITFVGFFIHVYSSEFMADDAGFARFFAFLNLFVCAMMILVLADDLLLLYLGWEGVGLCSYLLIGFWYEEKKNGDAARKAFIVTRVGDTAMIVGLFMLVDTFGTLGIREILATAPQGWPEGSVTAFTVAMLLLGGAVGKSAQLPLQTWLPDAMAGPSPVSALIHAATMVTAGVYLIARMHVVFELSPVAQQLVGILGAVTLLLAGFSALTQFDLKRVLAYSTISQIGYMFLALGVGAWSAAIFHFMIHAFFKALLFLAAGAVIFVLHHEHDMFRMGGLKSKMPLIFWTFLIGASSLAAVPFVTAGFYSKDSILWLAWASEKGSVWFFIAALAGAFVTSLYTFRMVFITFYGELKTPLGHPVGKSITAPLVILALLSVVGGFIELPHTLGHVEIFSDFLAPVLPSVVLQEGIETQEWMIQAISIVCALAGIGLAYYGYVKRPDLPARIKKAIPGVHYIWLTGWGFDTLYDTLLVRPFVYISNVNKADVVDKFFTTIVTLSEAIHGILSRTQSGMLRWYLVSIVVGTLLILTLGLLL